jgi:hypothetical protein
MKGVYIIYRCKIRPREASRHLLKSKKFSELTVYFSKRFLPWRVEEILFFLLKPLRVYPISFCMNREKRSETIINL